MSSQIQGNKRRKSRGLKKERVLSGEKIEYEDKCSRWIDHRVISLHLHIVACEADLETGISSARPISSVKRQLLQMLKVAHGCSTRLAL